MEKPSVEKFSISRLSKVNNPAIVKIAMKLSNSLQNLLSLNSKTSYHTWCASIIIMKNVAAINRVSPIIGFIFGNDTPSEPGMNTSIKFVLAYIARAIIGIKNAKARGIVKLSTACNAATKASAKINPGTAKKISVILIITSSVLPPKYPLILPITVPIITVRVATVNPIVRDTLEP